MRSPTSLVFAAHVLAIASPVAADLPTDSDETVSSIWLVPDATQDAFTTTLKAGDFLNLQWAGTDGLIGDTTADLWLAAYAYSVSDSFSQLLTKGVDLSVGGTFNWTVSIPQPQLDATPHYVLTFKSARNDFQFNASDPGLPSPGVSVIENDGDGLAEDNGTDGGATGSGTGSGVTILSSTGTNSTTFDTGDDEDDDDDDDSDSDSDSDDEDDDDDDDDDDDKPAASGNNSGNATASNTSLITSTNATCGGMFTCLGSTFGDCCSQHNFCGSTVDYCGAGCLSDFGNCDPVPSKKGAAKPLSVAATAGILSGKTSLAWATV